MRRFGIYFSSFENRIVEQESGDAPYGYWWQPAINRISDSLCGSHQRDQLRPAVPVPRTAPQRQRLQPGHIPSIGRSSCPSAVRRAFFHVNRLPYAEHYNFSFQRQFGSATILSVSYVGTQGHRLLATVEATPPIRLCAMSLSRQVVVLTTRMPVRLPTPPANRFTPSARPSMRS